MLQRRSAPQPASCAAACAAALHTHPHPAAIPSPCQSHLFRRPRRAPAPLTKLLLPACLGAFMRSRIVSPSLMLRSAQQGHTSGKSVGKASWQGSRSVRCSMARGRADAERPPAAQGGKGQLANYAARLPVPAAKHPSSTLVARPGSPHPAAAPAVMPLRCPRCRWPGSAGTSKAWEQSGERLWHVHPDPRGSNHGVSLLSAPQPHAGPHLPAGALRMHAASPRRSACA